MVKKGNNGWGPTPTTTPKGGKKSSGGWGTGAGSTNSGTKKQYTAQMRNAVGNGDVKTVKKLAQQQGLDDRMVTALAFVARQNQNSGSFVDRAVADATDTLTGAPRGLFNTAKAGVTDLARNNPAGLAVRAIQGEDVTGEDFLRAAPGVGMAYSIGKGYLSEKTDKASPFFSGVGQSFRHTTDRATDPQQALKDYSKHPVKTLLEDAGNVSIVAGGAAKAARAAGWEKTANFLETGAKTLDKTSAGPFLPVSPLARVANKGIIKTLDKASEGRMHDIMASLRATPAARDAKKIVSEEAHLKGSAQNSAVTKLAKPVEKILPSLPEQQALYAISHGQAEALARVRAAAPETFDAFVQNNAKALDNLSVKGAHLAADYVDKADPKFVAKIDQARPIAEGVSQQRTNEALARGTSKEPGGLNPEQLGYKPLSGTVNAATAELDAKIAPLRERAQALRAKADEAAAKATDVSSQGKQKVARSKEMLTIGEFGPNLKGQITAKDINAERAVTRSQGAAARSEGALGERAKMLDTRARAAERHAAAAEAKATSVRANVAASVDAAPARLRPVVEINRAAVSHLTGLENSLRRDGLVQHAAQVGQAAGEIPTTLAALEQAGVNPPHFIRTVDRETGLPSGVPPRSPTSRVKLGENRQRTGKGQGVRDVRHQALAEARNAQRVIRNETVTKLESMPWAKKAGEVVQGAPGERALQMAPSAQELLDAGYAPLDPRAQINVDTPVVPKEVAQIFDSYHKPGGQFEKILEHTYDPVTRGFKTLVLPLSPSWQVGNMVNNTLMATFGGGVGPIELGHNIIKSLVELKRTGELPGGDRLQQHGATYEARGYLREGEPIIGGRVPIPGKLRALGRAVNPVTKGYQLNEFIDNLNRSAVYLSKKAKGYSDEQSLRLSLRVMGDFTHLSPFEQRWVRRVIPFYAWQKHMAKLALTMPIENPLRTAFTLQMANLFNQQDGWENLLPSYMQGAIPLGGDSYMSASNLFPFSTPFSGYQNPGSGLNPILKMILANAPNSPLKGQNLFTGLPYSRPAGTGDFNESGKALPTAPSILNQLRAIPPQMRLYDNLSGRNDVARYESGDVVKIKDPKTGKRVAIPTTKNDVESIAKYFGVNIKSKKDLQQLVDSILNRKVENYKAAHPKKPEPASSGWGTGGTSKGSSKPGW